MSSTFLFDYEATSIDQALHDAPAEGGVLAIFGATGEKPYLSKTTNLRRRVDRLLHRSTGLRERISRVSWRRTGSDFESILALYSAYRQFYGAPEARKRLKLRTPYFVRLSADNRFPRIYVSSRLTRSALPNIFGPFASRSHAERYVEGVQDLFSIRRCHEDLVPSPDHPGCVYGEMKRCSAPCQGRICDEDYAKEATAVREFIRTHGTSLLQSIAAKRESASEAMEFEAAAEAHETYQSVKRTADAAGDLVHAIPELRAVLFFPGARNAMTPDTMNADTWLLHQGYLYGPRAFSTLGVRVINEQAHVGTSLFAQPLMLEAIPLDGKPSESTMSPEDRMTELLTQLDQEPAQNNTETLSDHLALLKRWYYRPENKRGGTLCFPEPDGRWAIRKLVRAASKITLKEIPAPSATSQNAPDTLNPL